jgi:xanthine dehydrogenase iron-sulfur cluster and FAD-binding subunit A
MFWQNYYQPTSLDEALGLLRKQAGQARIVAGGTDVLIELQRGVKPTATLLDITKLPDLKYIRLADGIIRIGGLATHNDVIASDDCARYALPLAQACWEVGAPQIRTRATVAGNLITASPANDTITPLMALDAEVALVSAGGERAVSLREFYTGFRKTILQPDELLREIRFPALRDDQRGLFVKLGLRRAQAISVIDLAIVLTMGGGRWAVGDRQGNSELPTPISHLPVADARITLGALAPTIVRAPSAEAFLRGKTLTPDVCAEAGRLACHDVAPIDDVRGTAGYRLATLAALVADGLRRIGEGHERDGWPERPILLETVDQRPKTKDHRAFLPAETSIGNNARSSSLALGPSSVVTSIETTINGQPYTLAAGAQTKSLLDALREDAGLTGTKEGCAEGECGTCTVWLDGQAIMACLTPAAQARGARVTTIEGLAVASSQQSAINDQQAQVDGVAVERRVDGDQARSLPQPPTTTSKLPSLHPLQQAFIDNAAVQCGYCIPGMLMAGAKLLDECPDPDRAQARVALSGNICRCTGYRKILDAVMDAAQKTKDR